MGEDSEKAKARYKKRRDANLAKGLTVRGTERKPRAKPSPQAQKFVIGPKDPTYQRREPTVPKKNETREQRRARGYSIRGTPLARRIDESVAKRVRDLEDVGDTGTRDR